MDRCILHVDLNCCFAQIECEQHPELREKPVVVAGKEELRHGIVMAKNEVAKQMGITTACTLREARKICPDVIFKHSRVSVTSIQHSSIPNGSTLSE